MNWISIFGNFEPLEDGLIFLGGDLQIPDKPPGVQVGNFISDEYYGGGLISAQIIFKDSTEQAGCGLILFYSPKTQGFISAQLGGGSLVSINTYIPNNPWITHSATGSSQQLIKDRSYKFEVLARGSEVAITLDNILVLKTELPFVLPRGQAGIWARGIKNIHVSKFKIKTIRPKIFVIMQFTPPFNELYSEIISPVCEKLNLEVKRADETYGPGIIIADIARQISESTAVIADITPQNPNVYWEVGYAFALHKPIILIAQKDTELPFDISPFRTLFYENTIAGKSRIENGLQKNIEAIQSLWLMGSLF